MTKQLHAEWPINLELDGTYHNLALFFDRVGKFTRIVNISALEVKGKDKPDANSSITATCVATTFVLLDKPSAGQARRQTGGRRPEGHLAMHAAGLAILVLLTGAPDVPQAPPQTPAPAARGRAGRAGRGRARRRGARSRPSSRRTTRTTRPAGAIRFSTCWARAPTRTRRRGRAKGRRA